MKKILFLAAITAASLYAGEDFTQLTNAGTDSREVVQSSIKAWIWVTALIPFALSFFLFAKVKEYQERQEEQGQHQPKVAKYATLIGAIIGGFLIMFLVYGIFGAVLFDKSFGEMWSALVVDFFKNIL